MIAAAAAASCRAVASPRAASAAALRLRISASSLSTSAASSTSAPSAAPASSGASASSSSSIGTRAALSLAAASLGVGYAAGSYRPQGQRKGDDLVLPNGLPRSCCSCDAPHSHDDGAASSSSSKKKQQPLTEAQLSLPDRLSDVVGPSNVLSASEETSSNARYLKGARLGRGTALAIVRPRTLCDAVECLRLIVDAGCAVVPQGANTGLTGGSVPRTDEEEDDEGRPRVVMSMRALDVAFPIDDGERVVALAGVGISDLANNLPAWGFPDRESHSVLGSVFLNPTCAAGVAFGSGGTQLRKGPAYTDRALYCRVGRDKWGKNAIEIVNTLGVEGLEDADFPNKSGSAVEVLDVYARDVREGYTRAMGKSSDSVHGRAMAHDSTYRSRVCSDDPDVSRYNADTRGEDCNRSEGKVLILATVHDTFQRPESTKTFWISFRDLETALEFRREVCLLGPDDLPVSAEYMDRDSFDIIDESGRIAANLIKVVGTGGVMAKLWDVKLWVESLPFDWAPTICDKMLHWFNPLMPAIIPPRMMESGKAMDHHVAMTVGEYGGGTLERTLERLRKFEKERGPDRVAVHECQSSSEAASLNAFRFVAATAFRTWCVGNDVQGISVDYALPKNGGQSPELGGGGGAADNAAPLRRMRYSHFGCNVVHEDLAYGPGVDVHAAKMALKKSVESGSGGKLPAEHGHGTEYKAPAEARERWMKMDPLNVMNPGIGGTSAKFQYRE